MSLLTKSTRSIICTCTQRTLLLPSTSTFPSTFPSTLNQIRSIHAEASVDKIKRVPRPREPLSTPLTLLSASKRNLEQYEPKLGDWSTLFTKTGGDMREIGMPVKDRKYLLRLLESYRQGHNILEVANPVTPKKKFRGWGPKVQHGKKVR